MADISRQGVKKKGCGPFHQAERADTLQPPVCVAEHGDEGNEWERVAKLVTPRVMSMRYYVLEIMFMRYCVSPCELVCDDLSLHYPRPSP